MDINKSVEVVIDFKYNRAYGFRDGLAQVCNEDKQADEVKCGFIDKNGDIYTPLVFDWSTTFSRGLRNLNSKSINVVI